MEDVTTQTIENKIFTIRGVQVMLDRDLAELYEVETKVLNQAWKRNIERFPEEFCFQLTKEEVDLEHRRFIFEVTNCDLKKRKSRWKQISSLCFYRARRCYACIYS